MKASTIYIVLTVLLLVASLAPEMPTELGELAALMGILGRIEAVHEKLSKHLKDDE